MGQMFAFHASIMANTLNTPIIVFTRTGSMAVLLSHYRPSSTIFAFTNQYVFVCLPVFQKMSTFNQTYWVLIDMFGSYLLGGE